MCMENEKCNECDYVWDCPHSFKKKKDTENINNIGISTNTIHLSTRYINRETLVMVNGKEYPIKKISCNNQKIVLVVSE